VEKVTLTNKLASISKMDSIRQQATSIRRQTTKDERLSLEELGHNRKTLISPTAGVLDTMNYIEDDNGPIESFDREEIAAVLRDDVVKSLKGNLEATRKNSLRVESDFSKVESQNRKLEGALAKCKQELSDSNTKNSELTGLLKSLHGQVNHYDTLIRFFLNMREDINAGLSNQLVDKLTCNNLMFLDNIKNQKC
jgi:chromosome segregation ATPase